MVFTPLSSGRFATGYTSPYTRGSVRYSGDTGYPHGRRGTVGELIPGHMATTTAPSPYAEPPSYICPEAHRAHSSWIQCGYHQNYRGSHKLWWLAETPS